MQIDCHGHVSAPVQLWAYKASLLSHRGSHGRGAVRVSDDEIRVAANKKEMAPDGHLDCLKRVGTDMQLISPRPFQMMHSEQPTKLVHWFIEECNNIIYRQTEIFPELFFGIAGLPQTINEPIENVLPELNRCVTELGFKGCLLNPDPFENNGTKAAPLGDRYWYPLYEKLCELDVPAHIHSTGSRHPEREPYTLHFINEETTAVFGLINSDVLDDFPDLKIVVSHGGGAIPYQLGRFDAASMNRVKADEEGTLTRRFRDRMKHLYYDTVLYTKEAIELLIKVVGAERCLFGAECPGVGSKVDPDTGLTFDHNAPFIHDIKWLSDKDKKLIFEENAKKVFKLEI